MYYAGIGSRKTPAHILDVMTAIAIKLELDGYILRSGGAVGADTAFESGISNNQHKQIFVADNATQQSIQLASEFHPNWNACSSYVKKLHGRNSMIILGENLDSPVKFVICYTPDGKASGGTGLAIKIAIDRNIPILNLYDPDIYDRALAYTNKNINQYDLL